MSVPTRITSLPPLSLYVHIPWCVRKCPYCDFNSHAAGDSLPEPDYVKALIADLHRDMDRAQGRRLQSVFFGGGTPSLFSPAAIGELLEHFETHLGFESGIEITLEANPGTVEQSKFVGFRAAGVNRLSIGIQSFDDTLLQTLGRIHSADEARQAVIAAKAAGFESINLDLMHGLPRQMPNQALNELQQAIDLEPQHLSWYQLTIEPNTAFYKNPPPLPDDDVLLTIEDKGTDRLQRAGYQHYEISAFSRAGYQSRHNENYWQFGDYLGIGAGAHGKITDLQRQQVARRQKTRLPQHYLQAGGLPSRDWQAVEPEQLVLEFMLNALRLHRGVPVDYFSARTGLDLGSITGQLKQARQRGLLADSRNQIQATGLGRQYLNDLLGHFMPTNATS